MKRSVLLILVMFGFLCWASAANAVSFSVDNITNNNAGDAAIGEAQLSVDVLSGTGSVLFKFYNIGSLASSITDVYFDDNGNLQGPMVLTGSGAGVSFSEGATPSNLPGGQDISFAASFSADSDNPIQPKGVNPGEWLQVSFSSASIDEVLAALASGDLRIGIHVQGFASGGSESFVTRVTEPSTMLLLGFGLIGLAAFGRKRFF